MLDADPYAPGLWWVYTISQQVLEGSNFITKECFLHVIECSVMWDYFHACVGGVDVCWLGLLPRVTCP
jgi:hypothetical protein